jgi:type IV secretion system protein TrbL
MDSTILTDILGAIVNGASQGFAELKSNAEGLFYKLLIIEVVMFGIGVALNRIDVQRELVAKVLAISFVQFLLFRYVWLVDGLRDGFVEAGLTAAGSNLSIADFLDPSAFMRMGFESIFSVIETRFEGDTWTFLTSPGLVWLLYGIVLVIMFFAFAFIGLQIFLTVAEFYLISSLAIILIPFMVLQRTSFLGLRAMNSLISICIKLMVIAFVASLSAPVLEILNFTNSEPTIKESMSLTVGALAIALLMWRAPAIAMSLISGAGGLEVNGTILEPIFRSANVATGAGHLVSRAAGAGGTAVSNVAKAVSQVAGNVRGS